MRAKYARQIRRGILAARPESQDTLDDMTRLEVVAFWRTLAREWEKLVDRDKLS